MDDKIKSRIKKLLALSQSSNENESYEALQRAQAMLAEYKLTESDLAEEVKKACIKYKTIFSYGTSSSDHYLSDLAEIIAENFCCITYSSTPHRAKKHYVCFMGDEEDVKIAEEALSTANAAIIRGYNRVYKDMMQKYAIDYVPAKYFNPVKIGYVRGYLSGLKALFDEQKNKHQEWG